MRQPGLSVLSEVVFTPREGIEIRAVSPTAEKQRTSQVGIPHLSPRFHVSAHAPAAEIGRVDIIDNLAAASEIVASQIVHDYLDNSPVERCAGKSYAAGDRGDDHGFSFPEVKHAPITVDALPGQGRDGA